MRCARCGTELNSGFILPDGILQCPVCGARYRRKAQKRKPWKWKMLLSVLAAVLIGVVILTVIGFGRKKGNADRQPAVENKSPIEDKVSVYPTAARNIAEDPETHQFFINNELIVFLNDDTGREEMTAYAESRGAVVGGWNDVIRSYQIVLPEEYATEEALEQAAEEFMKSGLFEYVYINRPAGLSCDAYYPNDAKWSDWDSDTKKHWGADAIRLPEMWEYIRSVSTETVNIGIIDNQFYLHEDLGFAFLLNNNYNHGIEKQGHGTHVAGIIGAGFDNGKGIAGVATDCRMFGFSVEGLDQENEPSWYYISAGLTELAAGLKSKVINISMGIDESKIEKDISFKAFHELYGITFEEYKEVLRSTRLNDGLVQSIRRLLRQEDFLIVVAAGNDNTTPTAPGLAEFGNPLSCITDSDIKSHIIVVGNAAVDNEGRYYVADSSNHGDRVDVIAPGTDIYSTVASWDIPGTFASIFTSYEYVLSDSYGYKSGTSMAAPQVTGLAGAIWEVNPNLSAGEVKQIITETAHGNYTYRNGQLGTDSYKMIDAYEAVRRAAESVSEFDNEWSEAYREFVQAGRFRQTGLAFYSDEQIRISLKDYNMDGIPELMISDGNEDLTATAVYVFTYRWKNVHHVGTVFRDIGNIETDIYMTNPKETGLLALINEDTLVCYSFLEGSVFEDGTIPATGVNLKYRLRWYKLAEVLSKDWNGFISGSFASPADQGFSEAYREFIMSRRYLSMGQDFYEGTAVTMRDMDENGIPEILIWNGADPWLYEDVSNPPRGEVYVYTYKDVEVQRVGAFSGDGMFATDCIEVTKEMPGILYVQFLDGAEEWYYVYLKDGNIITDFVSSSDLLGETGSGYDSTYMSWYTVKEIDRIGWPLFLEAPFELSVIGMSYTADETYAPGEPVTVTVTVGEGRPPYTIDIYWYELTQDGSLSPELMHDSYETSDPVTVRQFIPGDYSDNLVGVEVYARDVFGTPNDYGESTILEIPRRK